MVGRPVSAGTVRTKGLKVSVEVLESTSLDGMSCAVRVRVGEIGCPKVFAVWRLVAEVTELWSSNGGVGSGGALATR